MLTDSCLAVPCTVCSVYITCVTIICVSKLTCRAAYEKWGESIREYQCVDVSQDMNNLAEYLLRGKLLCFSYAWDI